jgi:hypothetical protein
MEAILKYNLPDDQLDFDTAVNGAKWMAAMWQLDQWLRAQTKHAPDTMSADTFTSFEQSRDMLHEILQENSLKL